jgi:hypothetical protein
MSKKPDPDVWNDMSEDETTKKRVAKSGNPPKRPNSKGLAVLDKYVTKRTIFKGMSWIFCGDTGDGKTWLISSASELGELWIIDTEVRAQDTVLLEYANAKFPIHVVEPVILKRDKNGKPYMDLDLTLDTILNFVSDFVDQVEAGNIATGTTVAIESMSDFWDDIQFEGKDKQAKAKGKTIDENSESVEWSSIKAKHKTLVRSLNALRSNGINIIYSCRRNDTSDAKSREIRSEKNLPYDTQNIIMLSSEKVGGKKVHKAVIEKMIGKSAYEEMEMPTFEKLDTMIRTHVSKLLK